ncbi:hypothetical protein B0H14DRAFT_3897653 [Mycena olivaceomarginata]|nr:hypothetical protein B0H14DRAFT_3897653 [Mycena olivaceomarginata]
MRRPMSASRLCASVASGPPAKNRARKLHFPTSAAAYDTPPYIAPNSMRARVPNGPRGFRKSTPSSRSLTTRSKREVLGKQTEAGRYIWQEAELCAPLPPRPAPGGAPPLRQITSCRYRMRIATRRILHMRQGWMPTSSLAVSSESKHGLLRAKRAGTSTSASPTTSLKQLDLQPPQPRTAGGDSECCAQPQNNASATRRGTPWPRKDETGGRPLLEQHEDRVVETQLRAAEVWTMTWDRMDVRQEGSLEAYNGLWLIAQLGCCSEPPLLHLRTPRPAFSSRRLFPNGF